MKLNPKLALFLVGILCLGVSTADTIETRDGQKVIGQPVAKDEASFTIRTNYGDLKIPRGDIVSHVRSLYEVELNDGSTVKGRILSQSIENVRLRSGSKEKEIARREIKSIRVTASKPAKTPIVLIKMSMRALELLKNKKYPEAIRLYEELIEERPNNQTALYNMACAYSLTGKKEEALVYLQKSLEAGFVNFAHLEKDPDLDPLREEPGYRALLKKRDEYTRKAADQRLSGIALQLQSQGIDSHAYKTFMDEERNFLYFHKRSDDDLAVIRKDLNLYAEVLWRTLFQYRPQQPLYIVLLTVEDSRKMFKGRMGGYFNPGTNTLFCGNLPAWQLIKTSVIYHEFTHALHFADQSVRTQQHPIWLIEGLGSLYETADRGEKVTPKHSQRLAVIQRAAKRNRHMPWNRLMKMEQPAFIGSAGLAYAQSRYMLFYMWEQGLLKKFYDEYTREENFKKDKSAIEAFEVVFGKPIAAVEKDWKQWLQQQKVPPVPFLGVSGQAKEGRLVLTQVVPKSSAEKAGLKKGDALLSVDGTPTTSMDDLMKFVGEHEVGDVIELAVSRGEEELAIKATLGKRPPPQRRKPPKPASTAYLGLTVAAGDGVITISAVAKDSPAEKAGIPPGAVILEFNGKPIKTVRDYLTALKESKPNQPKKLKIKTEEGEKELEVKLGKQ